MGGPLVDRQGRAIGVNTYKSSLGESIGLAVAIDHARALLEGDDSPPPVEIAEIAETAVSTEDKDLEAILDPAQRPNRARNDFLVSMYRLSKQANLVDSLWQQNRGRCLWRVSAGPTPGREWFGILGRPWSSVTERVSECRAVLNEIVLLASGVRFGLRTAETEAEQAGVSRTWRRYMRREYRLDWSDWEY